VGAEKSGDEKGRHFKPARGSANIPVDEHDAIDEKILALSVCKVTMCTSTRACSDSIKRHQTSGNNSPALIEWGERDLNT